MNDNNIEEEDAPLSMAILYDLSLIVVHALCAYPHVLKWGVNCNDVTKLGAFGDMFGPLNPLVSAFAFIALVFSLCIQQHQLKLQRKDLRYQRVELGLQRGEMVKQREVSEAQTKQFESQVNLEKTAQTTDELYRRLSIVIQLGESITFSYTHNSGMLPSERVEERGARAVRSMHIRALERLYGMDGSKASMERNRNYFLDRYENMACWHGSIMETIRFVFDRFDEVKREAYVQTIVSTCSTPYKFFVYLFAGAENPENGLNYRRYFIEHNIVPSRILPAIMQNEEFMSMFDETLIKASSHSEAMRNCLNGHTP